MSEWLNFRHLYSFWMVARTGSFSGAAASMHVAQSAVSSQVASLEDYLGHRLFHRGRRSVELTAEGRVLLVHARAVFEQSRAINSVLRDGEADQNTRFRLGVVGGASRNFVFRIVERLINQHPQTLVSVSTGSYEELFRSLRRFELDTVVTLEPPERKETHEVSYLKLDASEMVVAGTPELIARVKEKKHKGALRVFAFQHPYDVDVLPKYVAPRLRVPHQLSIETDDVPLLRFLANSGDGVAVIPRVGVLEDIDSGAVDTISLPRCPEVLIYGVSMSTGTRFTDSLMAPL